MPRKPKRKQKRSVNKKPAFIAAFIACGSLTEAAAAVKINRHQHYDWLAKDPKYVAAFAAAKDEAVQTVIDSAVTRALRGVYEPIVYQGSFSYPLEQYQVEVESARPAVEAVFGVDAQPAVAARFETRTRAVPGAPPLGIYRRSEMLHGMLLRAWVPAFRMNAVEVTGAGGGPIQVASLAEVLRDRKARREDAKDAKE